MPVLEQTLGPVYLNQFSKYNMAIRSISDFEQLQEEASAGAARLDAMRSELEAAAKVESKA